MTQLCNWSLEKNVGDTDKAVRAALAFAMLGAACSDKKTAAGKALLFLGATALLATSITGKCPAYQAAGIDTRHYSDVMHDEA